MSARSERINGVRDTLSGLDHLLNTSPGCNALALVHPRDTDHGPCLCRMISESARNFPSRGTTHRVRLYPPLGRRSAHPRPAPSSPMPNPVRSCQAHPGCSRTGTRACGESAGSPRSVHAECTRTCLLAGSRVCRTTPSARSLARRREGSVA